MRKKNRYNALFSILGLAFVCVVVGIIATAPTPAQPVKILMPNAGGRVIFNHRQHAEDYGISCSTCHHLEISGSSWDRDMHDLHAEDFAVEDGCQTCHHDAGIEPEPMSCLTAGCHERIGATKDEKKKSNSIPARDAVHQRCYSCHAHEDTFNEGLAGCASCHDMSAPSDDRTTYTDCAVCHTQPLLENVLMDRMETYHKQCGDCHADLGGPSVEQEANQCYQCHIR